MYQCKMQHNIPLAGVLDDNSVINKIYNLSPMQTEISQPEGKQILLETRFTEFPELSADSRVEILDLHQTNV